MLPRDSSGDALVRLLNRRYGYRVIHQRSSLMRLLTDIRGHKRRVSVPRHSQLVAGTLSGILSRVAADLEIN